MGSSLCNLRVLCVSVVIGRRCMLTTEDTEVAQRRPKETHAGFSFYWTDNHFLPYRARLCPRLRKIAIGV